MMMDRQPDRARLMTFEEAAQLDPDEYAGDLDAGRWVPVPRNTWRHGEILINAGVLLRLYARSHPGWSVSGADPGTKLAHNPDVLRGPDVGIVRTERKPTGKGADGWLEGAPDVVVEVIGDSQTHSDLAKKTLAYLAAGAQMVWIIDPEPQQLILYTAPNHVRVLARDEVLDGGDVLPGFVCKVAEFFE